MKTASPALLVSAAAIAMACLLFVQSERPAATVLAAQQSPVPSAAAPAEEHHHGEGQPHAHPAPTNLKVLPKNLTGEQVHEIMEQWEQQLGAKCSSCHTADPNNIGPNSKPRLNYADDSKEEKEVSRRMYLMTEQVNRETISKIKNSGVPVTCGTCHRGHFGPEPFVPEKKEKKPAVPVALPPQVAPIQ